MSPQALPGQLYYKPPPSVPGATAPPCCCIGSLSGTLPGSERVLPSSCVPAAATVQHQRQQEAPNARRTAPHGSGEAAGGQRPGEQGAEQHCGITGQPQLEATSQHQKHTAPTQQVSNAPLSPARLSRLPSFSGSRAAAAAAASSPSSAARAASAPPAGSAAPA